MFQFIKLADFLWFYLESKIIHFQSENRGKKVVLRPNKIYNIEAWHFSFPSCDWLY